MERLKKLFQLFNENEPDGFILFAIAKEYEKKNKLDKAEEYFLKLINTDPDYVGAYYHIASLYKDKNDNNSAYKYYNKGMEVAEKLQDFHTLSELKNAKLNLELEEDA